MFTVFLVEIKIGLWPPYLHDSVNHIYRLDQPDCREWTGGHPRLLHFQLLLVWYDAFGWSGAADRILIKRIVG